MYTGVTMNQTIHAHLNPRSARAVTQGVDPFTVHLGFFDAHVSIVAHRLRTLCRVVGRNACSSAGCGGSVKHVIEEPSAAVRGGTASVPTYEL